MITYLLTAHIFGIAFITLINSQFFTLSFSSYKLTIEI